MLRAWIAGLAIGVLLVLYTTTMMPAPTIESRKGVQLAWRVPHYTHPQEKELILQKQDTNHSLPLPIKMNEIENRNENSVVDSSSGSGSPAPNMSEPGRLVKEILDVLVSFQ